MGHGFEKVKEAMQELHEKARVSWEKYLTPAGMFKLLQEVIQVDLTE